MRPIILAAALAVAACAPERGPDTPQTAPEAPEHSFREGRIWVLDMRGTDARLAYGTPQTDDVALMMRCAINSGHVDLSFTRGNAEPTDNWPFTLRAGGVSEDYVGEATSIELGENAVSITARAPLSAAPLQALRDAPALTLEEQGRSVEMPVTPEQRGDIDRFFTACRER